MIDRYTIIYEPGTYHVEFIKSKLGHLVLYKDVELLLGNPSPNETADIIKHLISEIAHLSAYERERETKLFSRLDAMIKLYKGEV